MFAALRNTGKLPCASGTEVTVACFPGLRLVFLRDWGVSAKLVADRDASGLSDTDALLVGVRALASPMKAKMLGRMAKLPAVWAFMFWQGFRGSALSQRRIRR